MAVYDVVETAGVGADLTLDEAIARYYGEWVLMRITAFDSRQAPAKGVVLAHSPDRDVVSDVLCRQPANASLPPDAPRQPYYTFNASPRVHVGESYEQAKRRFAAQCEQAKESRRAERQP